MSKDIVVGSLAQIAERDNKSIAETFLSCEVVVLIDVSGSMSGVDFGDGKSRWQRACDELALLQSRQQGKVAVVGFSSMPVFVPGGVPPHPSGGTRMAAALEYTKIADVEGITFFLISDGEPTDGQEQVLAVARTYRNKINTIFCGPEGGAGQWFLSQLAEASGGRFATAEKVVELASTVETLLLEG